MKNSEYWRQRFAQLEAAQNRKGAEVYAEIEKQYRHAQKEIEAKIDAWYRRFADNNGVSMAEARRMLSVKELAELKWDVNDYIRHGQANAFNQKWMKELENASVRFHISRLEALKLQTQQSLEVMFGNQLDGIDAAMKRIYLEGYYHTAFELQKGFGVGWDIAGLDQRQIEKVVSKPWAVDGKNFSERIWGNKERLISEVHTELTRNIMLGQDPQKAIDNIARKMNTSKANAGRLVMTEEAYFSSAAQKDCFNGLDVEKYEIVATLDSHTSEICQGLDGQVFPMKDFEPGVTAPPFHVNCRSTTVPYFEDDFGQPGERAAKGEDGKTYYVPADMTYQEWKESFVKEPLAGDDAEGYNNAKQMKISFPDDVAKIRGMTQEIREELDVALDKLGREYDIRLDSLTVEPAGKGDRFIVGWHDGKMGMVINRNADFEKIRSKITQQYDSGYFAGKSFEDYMAHEMFHVMVYQDCESEFAYKAKYEQIEALYGQLKGISGYADSTKSGNEALAEAFVRIRNGEDVPLIAKVLVEAYIERWKK